jgi:hypothetical protein
MIPRILAGATLVLALFTGAEFPASAECQSDCKIERTQIQICSTCCKTCFNAQGIEIYNYCNTRCVWL